jgi:hypothetical protein
MRLLLATLCLLTLATSAHAGCAWVLWVETPGGSGQWRVATWVQPPRFAAREHCEAARTAMNALKAIDFRTHGLDSEANDAYSCLPDTVDPSGPKGK